MSKQFNPYINEFLDSKGNGTTPEAALVAAKELSKKLPNRGCITTGSGICMSSVPEPHVLVISSF